MSRALYADVVTVVSVPLYVPISWVTEKFPLESKAKTLLALSLAPIVNSVESIVFVRDTLIERSSSSCWSCSISVSLSSASSWLDAGNGSLGV